jgi:hypothetical protein
MIDINFDSVFFDKVFPVLISIGMILWIYCIWFLNKYDKNTNRLLMLLILNFYYVPFYLFRIKRIRKENRIKAISEEMYDADFIELSRNSIIDTIGLWTSKEKQLENQESESDFSKLQELIQQWVDFYRIDKKIIDEAFNDSEKELLKTFDNSVSICIEKFGDDFPKLDEFQKTNDWKVLNQLAIEIKKEIE